MSSSESEEDERVPYRDRAEWADVAPIPQDESANPVVRIAYSEEHAEASAYFRAIVASDERSERALRVTEHCIALNGADYTAWHRRWVLISDPQNLAKNPHALRDELAFAEKKALRTPKNYQVWNHVRLCVGAVGTAEAARRNLKVVEEALDADAKNYHAWSHRGWVVARFGLWEEEKAYASRMIDADVRNNSAWSARWHCVVGRAAAEAAASDAASDAAVPSPSERPSLAVVDDELAYVEAKIDLAPDNESAWNYARGLLRLKHVGWARGERVARRHCGAWTSVVSGGGGGGSSREDDEGDPMETSQRSPGGVKTRRASASAAAAAMDGETPCAPPAPSRHALGLLAEILTRGGGEGGGEDGGGEDGTSTDTSTARAREAIWAFSTLAKTDVIRANYWTFRKAQCEGRLLQLKS